MIYPAVLRAGVRKPPRTEPAGVGWAVCRLWGFDGAVACVGDALAWVGGGGSTTAVGSLSPLLPSTGRFRHDQRHSTSLRRCRGDSDATPEVLSPEWHEVCGEGRPVAQAVEVAEEREPGHRVGIDKLRQEEPPEQVGQP